MAYEDVIEEAKAAIRGMRRPSAFLFLFAVLLCTLSMRAQGHPADQLYLQTAGHAISGATTYATDLFVTNATGDRVDVTIVFVPVNSPAARTILPDRIHLGPYEHKELIDPLPGFGVTGIGMLIFNSCVAGGNCASILDPTSSRRHPRYYDHDSNYREISVSARIYSRVGTNAGTRGEMYPAVPWYEAASVDGAAVGMDRPFITGVRVDGHYRTNIDIANASQYSSIEIVATLYDGIGRSRGICSVSLGLLESRQMAAEAMFPVLVESRLNRHAPVANPWIRFEQVAAAPTADAPMYGCADGCSAFLVQGSMIDSLSGDAMLLEGQFGMPSKTCGPSPQAAKSAQSPSLKCSIEPSDVLGDYRVLLPDGRVLMHVRAAELDKARTMCGGAAADLQKENR